ncbi:MAG: hypothetical protein JST00_40100 [Deltaproteobacteria bacterium]|nr:hypothetical protein [Deltaproteobacteria bacterium]
MKARAPRRLAVLVTIALALIVSAIVACNSSGFDPQSKVDSVRMFVVKADKPYVKPGESVTLEALVTDARKAKPRAAKLYWIPLLCLNPRDDLYYFCFAPPGDGGTQAGSTRLIPLGPLAALADAGADGGANPSGGSALSQIPTGVDLSPFLPQGPSFTFTMPADAVQARTGALEPYGLGIVFSVLCAGRVELASRDPAGGNQQVPVRCTDEDGNALPPSDYVIGISRVYAYADRINTNPVIEKVTFEGQDVDLAAGITLEKCAIGTRERDCKENKIDVRVSDSSWEQNPGEIQRDGQLREQIWAAYYSDVGVFENEARLLFDTRKGRAPDSAVTLRAGYQVVDGSMWIVVHDNRGGASWVVVPLHVR